MVYLFGLAASQRLGVLRAVHFAGAVHYGKTPVGKNQSFFSVTWAARLV
jgi:hypothetical protein